ncbi:MAG: carbohydrate ABC transporter permease, partial [Pseudomonadota bacterium]
MTRDWWKHLILIIGAIIVIAPFYMMVSYSFKSPGEIDRGEGGFFGAQELMVDERCVKLRDPNRDDSAAAAPNFPGKTDNEIREALVAIAEADCSMRPVVFNYSKAFTEAPLVRYLLNGVIVTASIFLIQIVVALPAAYALAKLRFWGREAVFSLVLFCLLIPVHAIALP